MKMNWGVGIGIFYVSFVLIVVGFVIFSTTVDVNMVTDNYYEKELEYQNTIEKKHNVNALAEKVLINKDESNLVIKFPALFNFADIKGTFHFYRPATEKDDIVIPINLDANGEYKTSLRSLKKGAWKLVIDWSDNNTSYYMEQELDI